MVIETTSVTLPGWKVVRKLGKGSFGSVYEIQRTLPGSYVEKAALKKLVIPRDPEEIEELRSQSFSEESISAHYNSQLEDLVKEYQMMQSLNGCPNIVNCHDLEYIQHKDSIGWDIYIRMELLKPLKKVLNGTYQEKTVLKLGLDLCNALVACHSKNIIHRDIKPGNILASENGTFKLGDFGIAKISEKTGTGTMVGTLDYMAPEVAMHMHYGLSADICSLGLVMYWMMNKKTLPFLPLNGKIPSPVQKEEAVRRRCTGEALPEPVNGSRELKRIVLKACAYDPKDRYESAEQLAEDLRQCGLQSETKKAPAPNTTSTPIPQPAPEPAELEEDTHVLPRQPEPAVPQQEKKPENAPEKNPPADGSDRPVAGTGETHEPDEPVNPPHEKWKLWKPLGIAVAAVLVVVLLFALLGLGGQSILSGSPSESPADELVAALYTSAIERVAYNDLYYDVCGFLFDLDGDTIDELVLCYTLPEEEFAHAFDVYDVENDQLITRFGKIYIGYKDAGGSHGNIGVEYHDGIPVLVTYAVNGWSSSMYDMYAASYNVNLYDCHTDSLVRSFFVDVDVDDSGCTISYAMDGKEISEDSFRQEIQQYKRIFLGDYGSSSYVRWNYDVTGSSFEQKQTVYDLLGSLQQTAKMSPETSPVLTQKDAEDIACSIWNEYLERTQGFDWKIFEERSIIKDGVEYYCYTLNTNSQYGAEDWSIFSYLFVNSVTGEYGHTLF